MTRTLAEYNLAEGDFVCVRAASWGGEIYRIVREHAPVPVKPEEEYVKVVAGRRYRRSVRIYRDFNGKRVQLREKEGYVQLQPVFDFFGLGTKRPKYVCSYDVKRLSKVDIVTLGSKYVELGNLLKEIMAEKGMEET